MTTLYTSVAKDILQFIDDNNLQFGGKLPSERSLAAQFKVSRSSVREAIRFLSNKGILSSRRGDGTYIAMPEQTRIDGAIIKALQSSADSREIFQLRYILEPQIAALAALNATPEQVDELKILAFDMSNEALSGSEVTNLDLKFHLAIAKYTGNSLLVNLTDCLTEILALSRTTEMDRENRVSSATRAHFKIVNAIAQGNADKAAEEMRNHIRFVEIQVNREKRIIDQHLEK